MASHMHVAQLFVDVFTMFVFAVVGVVVAGAGLYLLSALLLAQRCLWRAFREHEDPDAFDRFSDLATRTMAASFSGLLKGLYRSPAQFWSPLGSMPRPNRSPSGPEGGRPSGSIAGVRRTRTAAPSRVPPNASRRRRATVRGTGRSVPTSFAARSISRAAPG